MVFTLAEPLHFVIQGEGKHLGKKMLMIRLVGCNINCIDCDTKYTWQPKAWNKQKFIKYDLEKITMEILYFKKRFFVNHLLITGGEPGLWENHLYSLLSILTKENFKFDIETSGYFDFMKIKQFQDFVIFNISPKIGDLTSQIQNPFDVVILNQKPKNYIIKIVVAKDHLREIYKKIRKLQKLYHIPSKKIYLMPKGTSREEMIEQSEEILEFCLENGYKFSPRLQILLFNDQKLK
ncbi:MAG: radical SAM protein [Leptonema sp. (in: bacteria)]